MARVLAGVLLLCLSLPCYVWYAGQSAQYAGAVRGQAVPVAYQLLNESQPPPLEELVGLAADDAAALMDLRGFHWLLTPPQPQPPQPQPPTPLSAPAGLPGLPGLPAAECAPLVLVLVHTATDHREHRRLIRETWGSGGVARPDEVLVRFLVGRSAAPDAAEQQRLLQQEAAAHGDVVQGSFADAYRNMTYKHAMGLKWFATHCPAAKYVLKVDDDVLVNTPVLLDFVRRGLSPHGARRLLACTVVQGAIVRRTWRSKWRVAWTEFPAPVYPAYCEGWAILYSPDVALALYRELQRTPYFWIDDVLVTGVVAGQLGLAHTSWEPLVLAANDLPRMLAGQLRPVFMVALWYRTGMDMVSERRLWLRVLEDLERARALNTTWTPARRLAAGA